METIFVGQWFMVDYVIYRKRFVSLIFEVLRESVKNANIVQLKIFVCAVWYIHVGIYICSLAEPSFKGTC